MAFENLVGGTQRNLSWQHEKDIELLENAASRHENDTVEGTGLRRTIPGTQLSPFMVEKRRSRLDGTSLTYLNKKRHDRSGMAQV